MKTFLLILLLAIPAVLLAEPLRTAGEVKVLDPKQAASKMPVEIDLQILKVGPGGEGLFAHDFLEGIYVALRGNRFRNLKFSQGQVIHVKGVSDPGLFIPHIEAREIRILSKKGLPDPVKITKSSFLNPNLDSAWVEFEGTVVDLFTGGEVLSLRVKCYGDQTVNLLLPKTEKNETEASKLINRQITARGIAVTKVNSRRQMVARYFQIASLSDIIPRTISPDVPRVQVDHLLRIETGMLENVKLRGVLTYVDGRRLYLQDESGGVRIQAREAADWKEGEGVEITGLVTTEDFAPVVRAQDIKRVDVSIEPKLLPISPEIRPLPSSWDSHLVTLDADLLDTRAEGERVILSCTENGHFFDVSLNGGMELLDRYDVGSRLRLRGICSLRSIHPFSLSHNADGIAVMLRRIEDVELLDGPPFWNLNRILLILTIMAAAALVSLTWVSLLRRRVMDQTEIIGAQIEREVTLRERQSLARELHDTLEQGMSTLALQISTVARHRAAENTGRLKASLDLAQRMISHFQGECRESIYDLRLGELGTMSLGQDGLLLSEAELFNAKVEITSSGDVFSLNTKTGRNIERIVREASLNALRHGKAQNVRICYRYGGTSLEVEVVDDGCGFDTEAPVPRGHFGIIGMRERANRIRAVLNLISQPGEGSTLSLTVPKEPKTE